MKKVHMIGICGVGMSAAALLLKDAGVAVSGSDAECYGPTAEVLSHAGITPTLGYKPENIPADADTIIIGRNAKLTAQGNAEVAAALASGIPIRSFSEIIGERTQERPTVVVAGSYGKSSLAALLAHIISSAHPDIGYFIGALPLSLPAPARLGTGLFIAEGDEYPASHTDARAKFIHLHATDVVLTSVVHDHVNVYPTQESYEKPFAELLSHVPADGVIVVSADEPKALALAEASGKTLVTYGIKNQAQFSARDVSYGERTTFDIYENGAKVAALSTALLGAHNVENIVGAAAYVLSKGLLSPERLVLAVASFTGVRRRLDRVAPHSRIPVYEGFGSSYEKAHSAIAAMRLHFPDKKLVIVFEPHTFGWRNRANLSWYDTIFTGAARVILLPPETQGAGTHDQLTGEEILSRVHHAGVPVLAYESPGMLATSLMGDEVVLILTSGDLHGTLSALTAAIEGKYPA